MTKKIKSIFPTKNSSNCLMKISVKLLENPSSHKFFHKASRSDCSLTRTGVCPDFGWEVKSTQVDP
ncbi:CLUMA_CG021220, isoform A [Clunio marinus]|uniref:CLUMA_CG021220, isoform A n=1 Tax=Clunio marinus TaxID=568069 RepID=A0A1J1JAR0_9DIPT|nr:CLUMA_CG021220, isoform A [Clunio marinus]